MNVCSQGEGLRPAADGTASGRSASMAAATTRSSDHTVRLDGLAANCSVTGRTPARSRSGRDHELQGLLRLDKANHSRQERAVMSLEGEAGLRDSSPVPRPTMTCARR